jgi:hypothetical protein
VAAVACSKPTLQALPLIQLVAVVATPQHAPCSFTWGSMHTGSRQVMGWCLVLEGRGRPTAAQQQGGRHVLPPLEAAGCAKKVVARGVGGGWRWLLSCISNGTAVAAQLQHWPAESSCLACCAVTGVVCPLHWVYGADRPPMQHCRQLKLHVSCGQRAVQVPGGVLRLL